MSTVDDILSGGGAKSAPWEEVGATHKGEILKVEVVQARDIQTGEPAVWKDGSAKEQLRIILQTEERDDDDDDGQRAVYLKGGKFTKAVGDKIAKTSLEAVKDALKTAGAKTIEVGATLGMQFAASGDRTNPAYSPPKLFLAAYKAPVSSGINPDTLI